MAGDGERPKKSWREIDRARESGQRRNDESSRGSSMNERSHEYRNYKSQLNRLFDGGGAPAGGAKASVKPILEAVGSKAIRESLAAYRAEHGFPEDEEALGKILDLTDEALVLEALDAVARLHSEGRLKRAAAVKARIKTAQATIDDPAVQARVRELLSKI